MRIDEIYVDLYVVDHSKFILVTYIVKRSYSIFKGFLSPRFFFFRSDYVNVNIRDRAINAY